VRLNDEDNVVRQIDDRCPWNGHRCGCAVKCALDVQLEERTLRALERAFQDEAAELVEATR
jgi:hypothetical protein